MAFYLFVTFSITAILGFPIWAVLASSSFVALFFAGNVPLVVIVQRMFTAADSFPLLAIPLFMIAGNLMETGGLSKRLINFCDSLVGNMTGGLSMVAVLACMFFSAISGSGPATVAAIGGIMIPNLVAAGYNKAYAAALMAVAGGLGAVIPPSIAMVNFGIVGSVSISALFAAGFLPGILIGCFLLVVCYFTAKKHGYGKDRASKFSIRNVGLRLKEAVWALLLPVIVLGGIYGGVFTPTEAAAVAVFFGFVIGLFIYKDLKIHDIPALLMKSGRSTAMVMVIIAMASGFGWIMTAERIPDVVAAGLLSISDNKIIILLLITILLLVIGSFMETTACIFILTPILLPAAVQLGVHPVHFGLIMVVNLALGMSTPPVGVNLFVACGIAKLPVEAVVKKMGWALLANIAALLVVTYVEPISLIIPRLIGVIR